MNCGLWVKMCGDVMGLLVGNDVGRRNGGTVLVCSLVELK